MAQAQRGRGAAVSVEAFIYVRSLWLGRKPVTKLVLQSLADRADEAFSCYPSVRLIAAECELSERQVQRHLAWLREHGYVSDKERFRPGDGSQTSNRYFLHGPWDRFGGTGQPFQLTTYPEREAVDGPFRIGTTAALGGVTYATGGVTLTTPPHRHSRHPGDDTHDIGPVSQETPQGVRDDAPRHVMGDTHGASPASPLEPPEEAKDEAPPPPPSRTAEDSRGRASDEEGAATPRDLSAGTLDGTADASPAAGPAGVKSAPTPELSRADVAMARDVVARLPRWLQPGDDHERWMCVEVIAARIAVGYPPGVLVHELSANPVDHVASKPQFIASRLRKMAPWIPPARPASDRPAALDEVQARTVDPERLHRGAAAARAQMKRRQPSAGSVGQEDQ